MRENLIETVLKTVRNYDMAKPGDSVVVAVSGGPDSVFLLHSICKLKRKLMLGEIIVCHLDHSLRGKESQDDSVFVRKLAGSLGLAYAHKKADIKGAKPKEVSLEEAARKVRYDFFAQTSRKFGARLVATGHTLDDQAETIMMRLIKGASLKGIIGIPPVRREGDYAIIRPLLEIEKKEIAAYLEREHIPFRIDSTNLEKIYFRNVVRSEILPFLEKYNPRLKRSLFQLAEHLREDFDFIENRKKELFLHTAPGEAKAAISLKDIVPQPKAVQKEILRDMLEKAGGSVKKLSFRHWKEMESLISRKHKGASVHLPGGIQAARTQNSIIFSPL